MSQALASIGRQPFTIPIFLAPVFAQSAITAQPLHNFRNFSTTTSNRKKQQTRTQPLPPIRGNRDASKKRGVSAIRSTGPRKALLRNIPGGVTSLPKPQADAEKRRAEAFPIRPDHGLYQFFDGRRNSVVPADEEAAHGRAWTVRELANKNFDDLWRLYWVCVKEANMVATRNYERDRLRTGYGMEQGRDRLSTVQNTMKRIREVLVKRHEEFSDAQALFDSKSIAEIFPDLNAPVTMDADPYEETAEASTPQRSTFEKASDRGISEKQVN